LTGTAEASGDGSIHRGPDDGWRAAARKNSATCGASIGSALVRRRL